MPYSAVLRSSPSRPKGNVNPDGGILILRIVSELRYGGGG
jgi:hypothetical protein